MSQALDALSAGSDEVALDREVGYALKRTDDALHSEMDRVLRPLGLTVAQYACLELLAGRVRRTNSELARVAFVTRQSMNGILRGLEDAGLVVRPGDAIRGRKLPAQLTARGRVTRSRASRDMKAVERRMTAALTSQQIRQLRHLLAACRAGLRADP